MLRYERKARRKGYNLIAGIDEAGRGPLAGPVVASAVILKDTRFKCEVKDSKKLTPKKRLIAYREIVRKAIIGIGIIGEYIIDSINIRNATIMAMNVAVRSLREKPDMLLIDGNIKLDLAYCQEVIVGGDNKSLSIAAASIIAKVTRDTIMQEYHNLYPHYRFDLHKGYGTKVHITSLKSYGYSPIHRMSFKLKERC